MPTFAIFSQKYKNKQTFLRNYSTDHHHIWALCSYIQCASKLPITIPIFQSVSEWQRDKENFSVKNADFPTFVGPTFVGPTWSPRQCPLSGSQMKAKFIEPLHSSINTWKTGEDPSSSFRELFAWRSITKIYKTRNAWQSLAYSPLGATVSPPSRY